MQVDVENRKILAASNITKDNLILHSQPVVFSIMENNRKRLCGNCLQFSQSFILSCNRCNSVYLCSHACLSSFLASGHHIVCNSSNALMQMKLSMEEKGIVSITIGALQERSRALNTYLITSDDSVENVVYWSNRWRQSQPDTSKHTSATNWDLIKRLKCQYMDEFTPFEKIEWQKANAFVIPIIIMTGLVDDIEDDYDKFELIFDIMSKVEANSFALSGAKNSTVGRALFPVASFFQHDCAPNCKLEQSGLSISIKAINDIKQGSELTISYVDANLPYAARRAKLKVLNIECTCLRCESDVVLKAPSRKAVLENVEAGINDLLI